VIRHAHRVGWRLRIDIVRILAGSLESAGYRFWGVTEANKVNKHTTGLLEVEGKGNIMAAKMGNA
jgi:hypothetical protein